MKAKINVTKFNSSIDDKISELLGQLNISGQQWLGIRQSSKAIKDIIDKEISEAEMIVQNVPDNSVAPDFHSIETYQGFKRFIISWLKAHRDSVDSEMIYDLTENILRVMTNLVKNLDIVNKDLINE